MKVIILQHISIEDPGYIKDLMIKDGAELTTNAVSYTHLTLPTTPYV